MKREALARNHLRFNLLLDKGHGTADSIIHGGIKRYVWVVFYFCWQMLSMYDTDHKTIGVTSIFHE